MARTKLKMTGFARFFIVMVILAPLAYIGASYLNNENGIENFKNLFKGEISFGESNIPEEAVQTKELTKEMDEPAEMDEPVIISEEDDLKQSAIEDKDQKINELIKKNEALQAELDQKKKELEEVQGQLNTIKNAIGVDQ